MVGVFAFLWVTGLGAGAMAFRAKTQFVKVLPTYFFSVIIALFSFGIFGYLQAGWVTVIVAAHLHFMAEALINFRSIKVRLTEIFGNSISLVFITFTILSSALNRNVLFSHHDEFSHWGRALKATFLFDKVAPFNPVHLTFASYPPGGTLFEYFVSKFNQTWLEGSGSWAYQVLIFSLLLPFIGNKFKESPFRWMLSLIVAFATPLAFGYQLDNTIIDPILGAVFGYSLAMATLPLSNMRLKLAGFSASVLVLPLLKDSGLFLSATSCAVFLATQLFATGKMKRHSKKIAFAIPTASMIAAYALVKLWSHTLNVANTPRAFQEPISASKLLGLYNNSSPHYWQISIQNFWHDLFLRPIAYLNFAPLSYVAWGIFLVGILVFFAKKSHLSKSLGFGISVPIAVGISSVIYAIGLQVLYLFRFIPEEAMHLASFERYLGTFWSGIGIFITAICLHLFNQQVNEPLRSSNLFSRKFASETTFWFAFVLLLSPWAQTAQYLAKPASASAIIREPFDYSIRLARQVHIPDKSKIWIVNTTRPKTNYFETQILKYNLLLADTRNMTLAEMIDRANRRAGSDATLAAKIVKERISKFDYILVHDTSADYWRVLGQYVELPSVITDRTFYKVENDNQNVRLVAVR